MNARKLVFLVGRGEFTPLSLGDSLVFFLNPAKTKSIFQEGNLVEQVTDGAIGGTVGLIYDLSDNAMKCVSSNTAFSPILTDNGIIGLGFNGTFRSLRITNSKKFFSPINSANPVFDLVIPIQASTDGVNGFIIANSIGGANAGFYLFRSATNKFQFLTVDSGSAKTNYTTTFTLTVADGLCFLRLRCNGVGAGNGTISIIKSGVETSETFTVVAGSGSDSAVDCVIGTRANLDGTTNFNGFIGWIVLANRILTATEWTNLQAYSPPEDSSEMAPILELEYDPQVGATMWADTARTTPATDESALNAMDNNITSNFGLHNRNINASAAATYKTAEQNGYNAIDYNGSNSNFALSPYEDERAGKKTWIWVFRNRDVSNGSHLARGGSAAIYGVLTATGFGVGFPDYTMHTSTGDVANEAPLLNDADEYTVIVERTNGANIDVWSSANVKFSKTGATGSHNYTQIGQEAIAGWWKDGPELLIRKYNGHLSDDQISNLITSFNTKYNIP